MLLQKPAFLLFYHARAAEASFGEWLGVLWHGLSLDCTVAGYVTAFPVLVALASFWIPLSQRVWRIVLTVYFSLIALVTAAIFACSLIYLCQTVQRSDRRLRVPVGAKFCGRF